MTTFVLLHLSFFCSMSSSEIFEGSRPQAFRKKILKLWSFFHLVLTSVNWAKLPPNPVYTVEKARLGSEWRQQSPFLLPIESSKMNVVWLHLLLAWLSQLPGQEDLLKEATHQQNLKTDLLMLRSLLAHLKCCPLSHQITRPNSRPVVLLNVIHPITTCYNWFLSIEAYVNDPILSRSSFCSPKGGQPSQLSRPSSNLSFAI